MMKKILPLFLILLFGGSQSFAQNRNNPGGTEPTARETIRLIFKNGDIPLSVDPSCRGVGTSENDRTILDYLSGLLSFQTEPGSTNRIDLTYERKRDRKKKLFWICDLKFSGKDSETVWSWGVRFTIRDDNRKLLRDSIQCTGAG